MRIQIFKDGNYFLQKMEEIGISRATATYKINLIKFLSKFFRMNKSSGDLRGEVTNSSKKFF